MSKMTNLTKVVLRNEKDSHSTTIFYILGFVSLCIYFGAFNYPFIYDDIIAIPSNSMLHHLGNFKNVIFNGVRQLRVLQNITFAIDWAISGPKPWAFRLTNIVFHSINTILVYQILKKLSYSSLKTNILIGLFFFSPMQLQSVHYAMGRVTLLISFFYLLSINLIINKVRNKIFICFVIMLSFLAKETGLFIPVIFTFVYFLNLDDVKISSRELFCYLGTIPIYFIFYFILREPASMYEEVTGLAIFPVLRYLITQGYFVFHYLQLVISPQNQSIIHEFPQWTNKVLILGLLGLLFVSGFTIWSFAFKRKNSLFMLLFLVCIVSIIPTNTFIQVLNPFAEYRFYLINLFFFYIFTESLDWFLTKFGLKKLFNPIFAVVGILSVVFLYLNLQIFSIPDRAMTYALNHYPKYPQLNLIFAQMQSDQRGAVAEEYYQKAHDYYIQDPFPKRIHYIFSLARFRFNRGEYGKCIELLESGSSYLGNDTIVNGIYMDLLEKAKHIKEFDEKKSIK